MEEPKNSDAWRYTYEVGLRMRDGEAAAEAATGFSTPTSATERGSSPGR